MRCDICGFESSDPMKFVPDRRRERCLRCDVSESVARVGEQIRSALVTARSRPCADCGRQLELERVHFEARPTLSSSGRPIAHRTIETFLREIEEQWGVRCEPCHLARHGGDGA